MVERMDGMPEGVIGLRASGKLTKEDYAGVLEPALKEAMDTGGARVVFVLTDFEGLEAGAIPEDIKTGLGVEVANRKNWKRLAVVTDVDWSAGRCGCSPGPCRGSSGSTRISATSRGRRPGSPNDRTRDQLLAGARPSPIPTSRTTSSTRSRT